MSTCPARVGREQILFVTIRDIHFLVGDGADVRLTTIPLLYAPCSAGDRLPSIMWCSVRQVIALFLNFLCSILSRILYQ